MRKVFWVDLSRSTPRVSLVSRTFDGSRLDGYGSDGASIAADGRTIAWVSDASRITRGDRDTNRDAYLTTLRNDTTRMVSVREDGSQIRAGVTYLDITAHASRAIFTTRAALVRKDDNSTSDVYLWTRSTGSTDLVSMTPEGAAGRDRSWGYAISAHGNYVAFGSWANNLASGDTKRYLDGFIRGPY